jgi:hypothetical protein
VLTIEENESCLKRIVSEAPTNASVQHLAIGSGTRRIAEIRQLVGSELSASELKDCLIPKIALGRKSVAGYVYHGMALPVRSHAALRRLLRQCPVTVPKRKGVKMPVA